MVYNCFDNTDGDGMMYLLRALTGVPACDCLPESRNGREPVTILSTLLYCTLATSAAADRSLEAVKDVPGLPRVLLIGDSISMGYTLPVREALQGKANVHRPATNCSSTGYGLSQLDRWLGDGRWDVIHFNFGLHDAKLPPEGVRHAPPDVYEKNLRELVKRLKATGAELIWATTTPVLLGGNLAPNRRFGDVAKYNALAKKVMDENGVAVDDLYTAITPHLKKCQKPRDVHFTADGSAILAKCVAASIEQQLPKRK